MRLVKTWLVILAVLVAGSLSETVAAPKEANYSKLILGQWLGPRKIDVYHADGTWAVRRHEEAPEDKDKRRWSIKGNQLTLTYPSDGGTATGTFTILSLTSQELVLDADGYKQRYERFIQQSK